jgi:hypothetical protein
MYCLHIHARRQLTRDAAGRLTLPADTAEGRRAEAWRCYAVVVCACPASLWEQASKQKVGMVLCHASPFSVPCQPATQPLSHACWMS